MAAMLSESSCSETKLAKFSATIWGSTACSLFFSCAVRRARNQPLSFAISCRMLASISTSSPAAGSEAPLPACAFVCTYAMIFPFVIGSVTYPTSNRRESNRRKHSGAPSLLPNSSSSKSLPKGLVALAPSLRKDAAKSLTLRGVWSSGLCSSLLSDAAAAGSAAPPAGSAALPAAEGTGVHNAFSCAMRHRHTS